MPHLDEGMLHAFLDGELSSEDIRDVENHIQACSTCAEALEEARALRDESSNILAVAAPTPPEMPDFAEIEARAGSTRDVNKPLEQEPIRFARRVLNPRSLAWAATVALAVAVGWYARSSVITEQNGSVATDSDPSGRLTMQIPELDESAPADEESAAPEEPNIALRGAAQPPAEAPARELAAPAPEPTVFEIGGVQVTQGEPLDEVAASGAGERAKGAEQQEMEVMPVAMDVSDVVRVDSAELVARNIAQPDERERMDEPRARIAARAAPLMAQSGVTAEFDSADLRSDERESEGHWIEVERDEAAGILGGTVPHIAGLPVSRYEMLSVGGQRAVRVLQSIESGDLIELIVTPLTTAVETGRERKQAGGGETPTFGSTIGGQTVTVTSSDLTIRISADLPVDSLRRLAERIERN